MTLHRNNGDHRQWDNIYKVLKKTFNQELFFKCEDEIKILPDEEKLMELVKW